MGKIKPDLVSKDKPYSLSINQFYNVLKNLSLGFDLSSVRNLMERSGQYLPDKGISPKTYQSSSSNYTVLSLDHKIGIATTLINPCLFGGEKIFLSSHPFYFKKLDWYPRCPIDIEKEDHLLRMIYQEEEKGDINLSVIPVRRTYPELIGPYEGKKYAYVFVRSVTCFNQSAYGSEIEDVAIRIESARKHFASLSTIETFEKLEGVIK